MGKLIRALDVAPQTRKLRMPLNTSAGVLWVLPGVRVACATGSAAAFGEAPLLDAALVPDVMRALADARAWLCGMDAAAARERLDARVHSAPAAWALDTALSELERVEAQTAPDLLTDDPGRDRADRSGGDTTGSSGDTAARGGQPRPLVSQARAAAHAAPAEPAARDTSGSGGDTAARGGQPRPSSSQHPLVHRVRTAALAFAHRPAELEAEAARLVAAGEHTIKIKIGMGTLADDLALAHAARSAAGPRVALRLDANGAWDEDEARRRIRALAAVQPEFIEQPVAATDPAALARVRRASNVPIAADEAARDAEGARRVLAAEAADVLVLKPAALGSFRVTRELAAEAEACAVDVVLSSLFDGAVSLLAALRLAAELKLPRVQGLGTGAMLAEAPHHPAHAGKEGDGAGAHDAHEGAGAHAASGGDVAPGVAPDAGSGDEPTDAGAHNGVAGRADADRADAHIDAGAHIDAARRADADRADAHSDAGAHIGAGAHSGAAQRLQLPAMPEIPRPVAGVVEFCA